MTGTSDATAPAAAIRKSQGKKGTSALSGVRDVMSEDLRKVVDEEEVTFSWRRKPAADAVPKLSSQPETNLCSAVPERPPSGPGLPTDSNSKLANGKISQGAGSPDAGAGRQDSRDGKPPRPQFSRALVLADPKAKANPKKGKSVGFAAGAGGADGADAAKASLDIEAASRWRANHILEARTSPTLCIKLIAYDGSAPAIKASELSELTVLALRQWARGEMSGELACLQVDHWTQGEIVWIEEPGGALQQRFGALAGMLADVSLERPCAAEMFREVFSLKPAAIAASTVEAMVLVQRPAGAEMLVSEAEHALTLIGATLLAEGPPGRLKGCVQRELLRYFWAGCPVETGDSRFDDAWLLRELASAEVPRSSPITEMQQENEFLDTYLIRLLRLKRALAKLLDEWEKVDYYAILGIPSTATDKELKSAYRKACLRMHPDKGGDKVKFQELQASYARILEERARNPPAAEPPGKSAGSAPAAKPRTTCAASATPAGVLALEGAGPPGASQDAGPEAAGAGSPAPEAAELFTAADDLQRRSGSFDELMSRAGEADASVQRLNAGESDALGGPTGGVEALTQAQEAGKALLELSEAIGDMGPALSEAGMEVAEASLTFAARFSAVPASLLLTDIAMSCTFEASRMQHAAERLLDVRRDTMGSLQSLETQLHMAKIIGTVDAEVLNLSLRLLGKAAHRIMTSLKHVAGAVAAASQRAKQCCSHASSICAFAGRRAAMEEKLAHEDAEPLALEAPEGVEFVPPEVVPEEAGEDAHAGQPPLKQAAPASHAAAAGGAGARHARIFESRAQNHRLLRQLNAELLELQRRGREHLAKKAQAAQEEAGAEARERALRLASEALAAAADAADADFEVSSVSPKEFEASLSRHFAFALACGSNLAVSTDIRTQVLRLACLLTSEAVISSLEKGIKANLAARCAALGDDAAMPLLFALNTVFDDLVGAVVAARLA